MDQRSCYSRQIIDNFELVVKSAHVCDILVPPLYKPLIKKMTSNIIIKKTLEWSCCTS